VILDPGNPDRKVLLGTDVPDQIRPELVSFLKSKIANFAWSHRDMTGISSEVITHKLNIDPTYTPVTQKRRKNSPDKNKAVEAEV